MPVEVPVFARALVFASATSYWIGVGLEARRVRKRIGRSPNLRPRGRREKLLWLGWFLVIAAWVSLPFVSGRPEAGPVLNFAAVLVHPSALIMGTTLIALGHAGTWWCYVAMGDAWRIGINPREKNKLVTQGPYHWVRHPIYSFQILLLGGAALLLPTLLAFSVLGFHLVCVTIKAADEESYLLAVHGEAYRKILTRTGRFLPKWGT